MSLLLLLMNLTVSLSAGLGPHDLCHGCSVFLVHGLPASRRALALAFVSALPA